MNKKEMLESLWDNINQEEQLHLEQEIEKMGKLSDDAVLKMATEILSSMLIRIRAISWGNGMDSKNSVLAGVLADATHNMPSYIEEREIDYLKVDIARYNCLLKVLDV